MPIVDKINALTGKSAETIEDAIANIDIGGGGDSNVEILHLIGTAKDQHSEDSSICDFQSCDKTFEELKQAFEDGKFVIAHVIINMYDHMMGMLCFTMSYNGMDYITPCIVGSLIIPATQVRGSTPYLSTAMYKLEFKEGESVPVLKGEPIDILIQ